MRTAAILGGRTESPTPEQRRGLAHEVWLERREDDVGRRESDVWSRETALDARLKHAESVLVAARVRDAAADALDLVAERRERDLDLARMLSSASEKGYGADWPARRHAGLARAHAKADRVSSLQDLAALVADYVAE